jgi:hypothetical protein
MPDNNEDVVGKEPFFGFLEWMTVWAFISGGVFPLLWGLDGLVRVVGIALFACVVAALGGPRELQTEKDVSIRLRRVQRDQEVLR